MTQQTFELRETIEKTFDFLLSTEFHYQRKTNKKNKDKQIFISRHRQVKKKNGFMFSFV